MLEKYLQAHLLVSLHVQAPKLQTSHLGCLLNTQKYLGHLLHAKNIYAIEKEKEKKTVF